MKRKILMLNYEYPPLGGGAANATKYILKEFSKYDNLEVDLITSSTGKYRVEKPYSNVTIHFLDIGKNSKNLHSQSIKNLLTYSSKAFSYAKKLKKRKKFDLVHAFFGIPCGFLAKRLGLPYIVSLRGSDVPMYSEKYKYLDKLFFKRLSRDIWKKAEYVIANSNGLKDLALNTSPEQDVRVIYNGIDTDEFFMRDIGSGRDGKLRIISVGRLESRKGFQHLIKAVRPLKNEVELTIVGDGPLRDELREQANRLGLNINFLGIVDHDDLPNIYSENDVFVLASFNEGMSNTVLESISSGLGLIVTNTGGTSELVNDNGFIVKAGKPRTITRSIRQYLRNKSLVRKHSVRSRQIAENMSWENVADEYLNYYRKIPRRG